MKITQSTAEKLLKLYNGHEIPSSKCRNSVFKKMLKDEVLFQKKKGAGKVIFLPDQTHFDNYLRNNFGINDLENYIQTLKSEHSSRAEMVKSSSNSKTQLTRTFKGFLVNSYEPIPAKLNNEKIRIDPPEGAFNFIYDFNEFSIDKNITVVGIENSENFRFIEQQKYLFENITPLFVSRYPQSKDLITWLKDLPNKYLHFGDFDFEGIKIFLNEYKIHLKNRAKFFIPNNIERLIKKYGNQDLYNQQFSRKLNKEDLSDYNLIRLLNLMHKYKKVLEQEVLIN